MYWGEVPKWSGSHLKTPTLYKFCLHCLLHYIFCSLLVRRSKRGMGWNEKDKRTWVDSWWKHERKQYKYWNKHWIWEKRCLEKRTELARRMGRLHMRQGHIWLCAWTTRKDKEGRVETLWASTPRLQLCTGVLSVTPVGPCEGRMHSSSRACFLVCPQQNVQKDYMEPFTRPPCPLSPPMLQESQFTSSRGTSSASERNKRELLCPLITTEYSHMRLDKREQDTLRGCQLVHRTRRILSGAQT